MADESAAGEEQITFNVKSSSDAKYAIGMASNKTVGELKEKLSTSEYADVPPSRQRLIYSGRVLKDDQTLGSLKIKDGHTIHLVKSAESNARQNPANQGGAANTSSAGSTPAPAANVPTNIATGVGNNPLAGLTGARYAGFHGLPGADTFGPDGGMGPPPDPSQMLELMDNPMFLSQMNEAMNNPAVLEMMANQPGFRNNPMARQMLQNPEFRRLLTNPDFIRSQLQMQRAMGGMNNPEESFAMPGVTDTTQQAQQEGGSTATGGGTTATPNQPNTTGSTAPPTPFAMFGQQGPGPAAAGAGAGAGGNPFAALFGGQGQQPFGMPGATPSQPGQEGQQTQNQQPNPFASMMQNPAMQQMAQQMMQNPEAMRQMTEMMFGGGGAGGIGGLGGAGAGAGGEAGQQGFNPFAALGGMGGFGGGMGGLGGANPQPPDSRPPEEIYASQLTQLNEMGFYEFERNVQALRRAGGNVQGAIEILLSGV